MSKENLSERVLPYLFERCRKTLSTTQTIIEGVTEVAKYFSPLLDFDYTATIRGIKTFKNASISSKHRTIGNEAFGKKEFVKSMLSYNKSISHAPVNSQELALAYANRSAVLLAMGKLRDCISDIHRALDCGYPETLKYKLLLREAQCLRDLGQSAQAAATFASSLEALKLSTLSAETKEIFKQKIREEKKKKFSKIKETHRVFYSTQVPALSYGPNQEVPCASSALDLCYNATYGRHYVATRDINIGDILISEDPFVSTSSDNEFVHCCSHCQKSCFTLLPCSKCSWAMFCSEQCMTEARDQYHLIECPIISKLRILDEGLFPHCVELVVRCIAKVGLNNTEQYLDMSASPLDTDESKRCAGFNSDNKYVSSDFLTILKLENSFSKVIIADKLSYCLFALEVAKCFKPTDYLKYPNFTALIYHLFAGFNLNAISIQFSIFKSEVADNIFDSTSGNAIYPSASLFSHSCNANSIVTFYGNRMILRAFQPIPRGKQVTLGYGVTWPNETRLYRQEFLKSQYLFDCKCEACQYDWPLAVGLSQLSDLELRQLRHYNSDFMSVLFKLRMESILLYPTLKSLINNNNKQLVIFVNNKLTDLRKVLTAFYNNSTFHNNDNVCLTMQLMHLFMISSCGTDW